VWQARTGPGLYAGLGGVACDDDWCDDRWDSQLGGSIDATIGFFYRIKPNWVVFFDLSTGLLPSSAPGMDDDHGFLLRSVAGAEFHIPVTGWLDTYAGLGLGFAFLRFRGEVEALNNDYDYKESLLGVDIELRTGATVYLFSRVPGLGLGVYYRLGLTAWPTACVDNDADDKCDDADDMVQGRDDDLPFLHQVGVELRYNF
jgi:hypothetical protein